MRRTRIYSEQHLAIGLNIALDQRNTHYLANVLRIKSGHHIILFDGSGKDYDAIVSVNGRRKITATIASVADTTYIVPESPLYTVLALSISKGERMDFAVQKAVELGVSEIQPLITERVSVKQHAEHLQKKHKHWQSVAISACEQSGRSKVPIVNSVYSLDQWLCDLNSEKSTVALKINLRAGGQSFDQIATQFGDQINSASILIGPEGGLSDRETAQTEALGFLSMSLGQRMLRTETAPLVALSLIQAKWGDL